VKIQYENEKFELLHRNSTILSGASMTVKTSQNDAFSSPFTDVAEQTDGVRFCMHTGNEICTAELNVACCEKIAVFRLSALIPEKAPVFGYQKFLSENDAVTLKLIVPEAGPYTALYQHKEWWIRPGFCESIRQIPQRTQLLLWKTGDTYFAMLAVCGTETRADLYGGEGGLSLSLSTNCAGIRQCGDVAAVLACGEDPYACIREAVAVALRETGRPYPMREDKPFPRLFETLGWCSWDAFGHDVNQADLLKKLDELREKKIPVRWVLIDDGWSKVDFERLLLQGLDADKARFPDGLGGVIRRLKEDYGIRWVGVWQAVMGYWDGVDPDSDAYREFSEYLEILPDGKVMPRTDAACSFGFWNKWHRYLRRCGVDFVKVDSQSSISLFQEGRRTYGEAASGVHTGLEASAAMNFGGNLINCMGMAPEDIWNRQQAVLSRNSDDYVPKVPHAIREHALQNAYNSLLHGNFYWEDWDMFWSNHEAAKQNAILRALSGGPIYLSEPIGKTDPANLFPLVLNDGRILRCESVGLPTMDCLLRDPVDGTIPLKIFNHCGESYAVGVFNISKSEQTGTTELSSDDLPALRGKSVWVYDWENRRASELNEKERFSVKVEPDGVKLFFLFPRAEEPIMVGLTEKYLAFAAVDRVEKIGSAYLIRIPQGGTFAFLSKNRPEVVLLDGIAVTPRVEGELYQITCSPEQEHRIQIRVRKDFQ
jgi:raffinose synthase